MRLSTRVRYAVKAMLDLAIHYGEGPVPLQEIARRQAISKPYLENLMLTLKGAGLVRPVRGFAGGYSLAKPPSQIKLSHIITALEGSIALVECSDKPRICYRSEFCVPRDIWVEIEQAITKILDSFTLEEMVRRQKEKEGVGSYGYKLYRWTDKAL